MGRSVALQGFDSSFIGLLACTTEFALTLKSVVHSARQYNFCVASQSGSADSCILSYFIVSIQSSAKLPLDRPMLIMIVGRLFSNLATPASGIGQQVGLFMQKGGTTRILRKLKSTWKGGATNNLHKARSSFAHKSGGTKERIIYTHAIEIAR